MNFGIDMYISSSNRISVWFKKQMGHDSSVIVHYYFGKQPKTFKKFFMKGNVFF